MTTISNGESGLSVRTKLNDVLQHIDGASGSIVINESGADVDFRVESDTVTNALFVDGGSGNVGIGTSSPTSALDVVGSIEVSGGVYLGGTTSANLLDDYEEGTWTPSFTNLTIGNGSVFATYTKIGRSVTVVFGFSCGSTTSVGTLGDITGLPFTSSNDYIGFIKANGVAFDNGSRWYEAVAVIGNNNSTVLVPSITNYTSGISATNPMTWATSDSLVFTATYTTS